MNMMPLPEPEGRSRGDGEHDDDDDAPLPTDEQQQHLYLIFDDWPWGYSIRKLKLPPPRSPQPSPSLRRRPVLHKHKHKRLPLPPPCVRLEALRRKPLCFAAVGTHIIAAHPRRDYGNVVWNTPMPECIMPVVDVRSLGVRVGPGPLHSERPLLITVGDQVFALDMYSFSVLSMKEGSSHQWSWCDLPPPPPLRSVDVASFAVGSDGCTIFASTERATFAFDIVNRQWKQTSKSSPLPFAGPAYYVPALDIFVGLSGTSHPYGHLCFCSKLLGGVRLCKEKLLLNDPAEELVGATLVYLEGSDDGPAAGFCLVECVSITQQGGKSVNNMRPEECHQDRLVGDGGGDYCGELDDDDELMENVDEEDGDDDDELMENVDEEDGAYGSMEECVEPDELNKFVDDKADHGVSESMHDRDSYLYRLTTFSLSFDSNGDLTTGETCVVQCYKVPDEVSDAIYMSNPVAFWL